MVIRRFSPELALVLLYHESGYPIGNPLAAAESHRKQDQRQDKEAKEDHLTQGEDHRGEVEDFVLMRRQYIDQPEESPYCCQAQGVTQDVADGRAADIGGGNAAKLGAEHGPDDHEEYRDHVHVTADELPEGAVAAGDDDFQQVRSHGDM